MKIITRAEWGARTVNRTQSISLPTKEVWLHHSATTADASSGAGAWRRIQRDHQAKGWVDIGYSFGVTPDGQAWQLRGPGIAGAHTEGRNLVSHAICLLGNFETQQPTAEAENTTAELLAHGWREGWWATPAITGPHRDAPGAATACCGRFLIARIPYINQLAAELAGQPTDPKGPAMPDPKIVELQQIVLDAGGELPRWGADGYLGDETLAAVASMRDRLAAQANNIANLRARLNEVNAVASQNIAIVRHLQELADLIAETR